MEKSKEIKKDIRKIIMDLHKPSSSLGTISRCLKFMCKQLYFSINIIGMLGYHTVHEEDGFSVPGKNGFCVKCANQPQSEKQNTYSTTERSLREEEAVTHKPAQMVMLQFSKAL
ncbi:hypothetical protein ILYODFUR_004079 [Ilyodon furcidens]|uniref:Uncharacterized protein n=1 Tax=Ilyodon furcidens TaxID=33524 RepID=A0ABV0U2Y8_9TELE